MDTIGGALDGAKALVTNQEGAWSGAAEGALPFGSPMERAGLYNSNDPGMGFSKAMGGVAITAAGGVGARAIGGALGAGDKIMKSQRLGINSALFGKGGVANGIAGFKNGTNLVKGAWNTGDGFRLGWSWKGGKTTGAPVFRAVIGGGINAFAKMTAYFRHFDF